MIDLDRDRSYRQLERFTLAVARQLDLPVVVQPLPRSLEHEARGDCYPHRGVIRFPRRAPLITALHEMAHVIEPDDGHGDRWQQTFTALVRATR